MNVPTKQEALSRLMAIENRGGTFTPADIVFFRRFIEQQGEAVATLHVDTNERDNSLMLDCTVHRDAAGKLEDGDYALFTRPIPSEQDKRDAERLKFVLENGLPHVHALPGFATKYCYPDFGPWMQSTVLEAIDAAISRDKGEGL